MFVLLIILSFIVPSPAENSLIQRLTQKGLEAKVTVHVVDQDGHAVPDADIRFSFGFSTGKKSNLVVTRTDRLGIASAQNKTNYRIVIQVSKEGYYRTGYRYSVWNGSKGYETGRWEPWNPTITLVLYEVISPQNNNYRSFSFDGLKPYKSYAFDFLAGRLYSNDFVTNEVDMIVNTSGLFFSKKIIRTDDFAATNHFTFVSSGSGIIEKKRNVYSKLIYDYLAPTEGYISNIDYIYEQNDGIIKEIKGFPSQTEDYYIFRISRKSESEDRSAYYGVIEYWGIGKDWKTGDISFYIEYRLNPEPGDRNIEYN